MNPVKGEIYKILFRPRIYAHELIMLTVRDVLLDGTYEATFDGFSEIGHGPDFDRAIEDLNDQLVATWVSIGNETDEKLTSDALALRDRLNALFGRRP